MSRVGRTLLPLIVAVLLVAMPWRAASAAACVIEAGRGIGAVRLWMAETVALGLTGKPIRRLVEGRSTIYTVPPPFSQLVIAAGVVQRVSTRAAECRTPAQVGPGSTADAVRAALANTSGSVLSVAPAGEWLSYPFNGIAFFLRGGRVDTVEVFAADRIGGPRGQATPSSPGAPGAPGPAPAGAQPPVPAATWTIRALQARMDGLSLVVTGTVENLGRPAAVYAEVAAFDPNGRLVGTGDGPMAPAAVPMGGSGTFEARISPADVVGRVTAVIRPLGMITGALAQASAEIVGRQQFAPVVARRLRITTQTLLGPPRVVVEVRNESAATVAAVTVIVDVETRCFVRLPRPGRYLVDARSQNLVVPSVQSGGSSRATVTPPPPSDACEEFVILSTKARVTDFQIAD